MPSRNARAYYASFFGNPTTKFGLRPNAIRDPEQIRKLTAFFSWSAWAASTARPGHSYSYTNNWPPEPLVANHVTADAIVWSMLSLAALLGGTGLLLATFGRWNLLGWHGREQQSMSFRAPDEVSLTPGSKRLRMVLLCDGCAVPGSDTARRRLRTLPCGSAELLRNRPWPTSAIQHCPYMARAVIDFLGFHFLSLPQASSLRR